MKKIFFVLAVSLFAAACKKEAGEGGFASISGKLLVEDYNPYFTALITKYYAQGENVYIIYGNQNVVGNSVKTSIDGSFKFDYLTKGTYKVFAVSKDSAFVLSSRTKEVSVDVVITDKKQQIVLPDIKVLD